MKLRDHPADRLQLAGPAKSSFTVLQGPARGQYAGLQLAMIFNVPDDVWKTVIPTKYRSKVVCVEWFGNFACEK